MSASIAELASLCELYQNSVYKKDHLTLANIYHENILAFDLWEGGMCVGKANWSNSMKNWLTSLPENERVEVKVELLQVEVADDLGFAYGFVTYKAIDESEVELRKMKNRLSWGLVKANGNWLIAHQHTSVPIEFETTKAIFVSQ